MATELAALADEINPARGTLEAVMDKKYNIGIIGYSWAATAHVGAINGTRHIAAADRSAAERRPVRLADIPAE